MAQPTRGGALWLDNWILDASIASVTNQHVNYPARELLIPHRSESWQSLDAVTNTSVVFDLGQAPSECLAIVGGNFSGGTFVRLRGSDDGGGQVANEVYYDLPLSPQDPIGKTLR